MDEKRSDGIRAKNWTAYWDFKSPFYLLSSHSFRSSCPLKEKIRKNDKEEFRDRGRRGDVGFIYLNFIHKNRCALNVHIFVAVFVPANHIDPIHTRLPFLPFNLSFRLIINFSMFVHLERNERIKIGRRDARLIQDLLPLCPTNCPHSRLSVYKTLCVSLFERNTTLNASSTRSNTFRRDRNAKRLIEKSLVRTQGSDWIIHSVL